MPVFGFLLPLLLAATLTAHDTIQYRYDEAGRLIEADYGEGAAIRYTYDPAGNLLRREATSGARFVSVSSASFAANQALAARGKTPRFRPREASAWPAARRLNLAPSPGIS